MQRARILGNNIRRKAEEQGITKREIADLLGCSEERVIALYSGRVYLSYMQLQSVAERLGTPVTELITGGETEYKADMDKSFGVFSDDSNRERVLDIIEDYLDIREAVLK